MATPHTITVTRHDDGSLTADGFPDVIEIDRDLIRRADPSLMRVEGDRVFFTFANGNAEYRISESVGTYGVRAVKVGQTC